MIEFTLCPKEHDIPVFRIIGDLPPKSSLYDTFDKLGVVALADIHFVPARSIDIFVVEVEIDVDAVREVNLK